MNWQVRLSSGAVVRYEGAGFLQHGPEGAHIYTEKGGELVAYIPSGAGAIVERVKPEPEVFYFQDESE